MSNSHIEATGKEFLASYQELNNTVAEAVLVEDDLTNRSLLSYLPPELQHNLLRALIRTNERMAEFTIALGATDDPASFREVVKMGNAHLATLLSQEGLALLPAAPSH